MRCDVVLAHLVVVDAADDLALGGACVNHYLVFGSGLCKAVQHLRQHLHGGANRDGNDYEVAAVDAFIEADDLVGESYLLGSACANRISLDAEDLFCESPAFKVDSHGASDEAETYDSYYHKTFLILSLASSSTSGLAQRDTRT